MIHVQWAFTIFIQCHDLEMANLKGTPPEQLRMFGFFYDSSTNSFPCMIFLVKENRESPKKEDGLSKKSLLMS